MTQPIQLLKQTTDKTLTTLTAHNHDDLYPPISTTATIDTVQTLTNKTLTEPTLSSQTITLAPTGITTTEITLPAYSVASSYTLLTSQDVEAYKTKYVINDEDLKLKAQGFGISHLYWKLNLPNLKDETTGPWAIVQLFTDLSLASGESTCATGFLLETAEPYTVKFERNELKLTLPLSAHTITDGTYIIDTLLPTPAGGWIKGSSQMTAGISIDYHNHETSDNNNNNNSDNNGNIDVSYAGHYLSWDYDENTSGSITLKRVR